MVGRAASNRFSKSVQSEVYFNFLLARINALLQASTQRALKNLIIFLCSVEVNEYPVSTICSPL